MPQAPPPRPSPAPLRSAGEGVAGRPPIQQGFQLDPRYPRFTTILHALDHYADARGDHAALIVENRRLTYRQYRAAVAGMARWLEAQGARGARVGVCMGNGFETAIALLGAMAAGAEGTPVNPNFTPSELKPLLADLDPRVLLCDAASAERARAAGREIGIPHIEALGSGGVPVEPFYRDEHARLPEPLPMPDDPAVMFFTGGTTGFPKGAPHRHSNIMAHCYAAAALWPLSLDGERFLNVAPLFHVWGYYYSLVNPIYLGATLVLVPAYKPAVLLAEFERHRITVFAGGPPVFYVGLRANENFKRTDFSSLRYCLSGGAPCSEELVRAWERETGCALLEGIGMSEGAPIALNPIAGPRKVLSVGVPPPATDVEIVDLESGARVLPLGERGEIRVRGPQFVSGYRNRPDETATAFRDAWLHTGDIGMFDDDGFLFVVDRKKEMILVGGYNVYPREIDEVLAAHPAVLEVATVGVPDEFSGEAVKAFIALKPGATAAAEELDAWCRERLVKYKVPKSFELVVALPKSSVGKIDKLKLKGKR